MGGKKLRKLTLASVMAAMTFIGTMIIQVPTPTKGYIHIGDSIVYLCGIVLGPVYGALAAAIGSLLTDVLSGYMMYAPATFVIKGLDAYAVGIIYYFLIKNNKTLIGKIKAFVAASLVGGSVMVLGYLVYEIFLYGFATATLGIVGNITQAIGGLIIALPLLITFEKNNIIKRYADVE